MTVEGEIVGEIDAGIAVFVGVGHEDDESDADLLADRIVGLRIFADEEGRMNRSLLDTGGRLLVVSQFTLMGDTRRGRRPSFVAAAEPGRAAELVDRVVEAARSALGRCRERLGEAPELAGEDARLAIRALESLTGRVDVEDVLDRIFSQFCVGK